MVKRSNDVLIMVLNFVHIIIFIYVSFNGIGYTLLRYSTAALITHKGRTTFYHNAFPAALTCKKVYRSRLFKNSQISVSFMLMKNYILLQYI